VGRAEGYEIRLMGPRETRAYGVALINFVKISIVNIILPLVH